MSQKEPLVTCVSISLSVLPLFLGDCFCRHGKGTQQDCHALKDCLCSVFFSRPAC